MAKVKMKTHRGAAKRFRITAKGKVRHKKAFRSHLLGHKPSIIFHLCLNSFRKFVAKF